MLISGFQNMTLMDYPGKIAALIFTQGCNFACGYCHNAEMIPSLRVLPYQPACEPSAILTFLQRRLGLLDGVVISGGEPTLHDDLEGFIRDIRALGFLIKLDTNGSRPEVLERLFSEGLVDYIAMDIKHTLSRYQQLVKNDCRESIKNSIQIIMTSGVEYEFRSTLVPRTHGLRDIQEMGAMIQGAQKWCLQNFRPGKTLLRRFQSLPSFTPQEMKKFSQLAKRYATVIELRNTELKSPSP